jgi:hypothetical protein
LQNDENIRDIKDIILGGKKDDEFVRIMDKLIHGDKDIDLKTEINHPVHLTILKSLSELAIDHDLPRTSKTIETFIKYYFRYMISKGRKSREEIIQGLQALSEKMIKETKEIEMR